MATTFTTPKTWAFGDALTAVDTNLYIRDNTKWLGTDKPACSVKRTSVQTLTTNTETGIDMTTSVYDNQNLHSTVTNPSRYTIPVGMGGKYLMIGGLVFVPNATGYRVAYWRINGGGTLAGRIDLAGSATTQHMISDAIYQLAAGDYVEFNGFQTSGGGLDVQADNTTTTVLAATLTWIGT
jgi:hypothetical protein